MPKTLLFSAQHLDDDGVDENVVAEELISAEPMWMVVGNFCPATLRLLAKVPRHVHVYWKIEFMGSTVESFLGTAGNDPGSYVEQILQSGHLVVPFSFNDWNRSHIVANLSGLKGLRFDVHPIAQKIAPRLTDPQTARKRLMRSVHGLLFGVAGLYHPVKGVDELVRWIVSLPFNPAWHWAFSLITDQSHEEILSNWLRMVGPTRWFETFSVRQGCYREWPQMAEFYQSLDVAIVNSRSDSWGRAVSEPVGLGTPVLVRKSDCGTNQIFPGMVLIDDFGRLEADSFLAACSIAKARTAELQRFSLEKYSTEVVRASWLTSLRAATPEDEVNEFDRLVSQGNTGMLDSVIDW